MRTWILLPGLESGTRDGVMSSPKASRVHCVVVMNSVSNVEKEIFQETLLENNI